jgi:hypothetical protein
MSNSTGAPTQKYYEWLAAAEEQRRLPPKILAACQIKALWILRGRPVDGVMSSTRYTMTVEDGETYKLVSERVEQRAKALGISAHELTAALSEVEKLPFDKVLKMATLQGFFDSLMPEVVLVMDVMSS